MSTTPPHDVLWLDGQPDEAIVLRRGERRRALGSDPFAADPVPDPFAERLADLRDEAATPPLAEATAPPLAEARSAARPAPATDAPPREPDAPAREPEAPAPSDTRTRPAADPREAGGPARQRRRWAQMPRVDEIELADRGALSELWLGDDVRRRLAALTHLTEGGAPYDRYGFSPAAAQSAFPFFHALYRGWFRVRSEGHERLPVEGPAVLAANHGGLLPFDGAMTVVDVLLHTDPPRLPRAVVDRWAGTLPWVNVFFARVGQVIGTRENVMDLLDDGQLVLVFPEGMDGVRKNVTQRYRLQRFHVGFVEAALRRGAPIVPMAVVGSDDQAPVLFDLSTLARRLALPFFPVTPTFPWLGPLGLLPYPVSYKIVYGEPLHFHERFGPDAADDAQLVRYLANQVRREVQGLLDRHR